MFLCFGLGWLGRFSTQGAVLESDEGCQSYIPVLLGDSVRAMISQNWLERTRAASDGY